MEKLNPTTDGASPDITAENIDKLRELFPDAFTEGSDADGPRWKVDFDALKQILGEHVEDERERYSFTWHGKARARRIAQTPSNATLRPCPEESVNWDTTKNLFIEGDNLEVLKLLQKSYHKQVKMIYIDPPYNTGGEFIYPDRFQDNLDIYLRYTGQVDAEGFKVSANSESSGRYHTNWLNMMYPRLRLARNLLRDDGVIFVSIDDHESANLQKLCDEIFGEENFRADISWQKRYTRSNNTVGFTTVVEHILVYGKSEAFIENLLPRTAEADARYSNPDNDLRGPWKGASFLNPATPRERPNLCYPITNPLTGSVTEPRQNAWRRSKSEFDRLQDDGRLYWGSDKAAEVPAIKMFLSEARGLTPINFWDHEYAGNTDQGTRDLTSRLSSRAFDNPKPVRLLRRVLEHSVGRNDIVLDFFAGSATLGDATMQLNAEDGCNRRFVLVQLPEPTGSDHYSTIAEIGKARLRASVECISSHAAEQDDAGEKKWLDTDLGFRVFKLSSSNIVPWQPDTGGNLKTSLFDNVDNIRPNRQERDVLAELLLKFGLDLAVPIEEREIAGKTVHVVGAGALVVCLADQIDLDVVDGITALKAELAPEIMRVVFKDSGFADDVVKTNAVQRLRQAGIDDVKSL